MAHVKLVLSTDYCDDYHSHEYISQSITDWDEVTEEELIFLVSNYKKLSLWKPYTYPILLIKNSTPVEELLVNIKDLMAKQLEESKKRKAAVEKAQETKRKNKEEKERKLLEELKGKYGA